MAMRATLMRVLVHLERYAAATLVCRCTNTVRTLISLFSKRHALKFLVSANGVVASNAPSTPTPSTNTPSSTPKAASLPTGWSYSGCYIDNAQGRIIANQQSDSSINTIESCIATCSGLGYSISAMESSSQCFCDNYIRNAGTTAVSDSPCAMPCSGNSSETCAISFSTSAT